MSTPAGEITPASTGSESPAPAAPAPSSAPSPQPAPEAPPALSGLDRVAAHYDAIEAEAPATDQPVPAPAATSTAPTPGAAPATTAEPAPGAPPAEPEIPAPGSLFAPIYSLTNLPDEQALPKGIELIQAHQAYDPSAHRVLQNSMYAAHEDEYRSWVLQDLGVPQDKVKEFAEWAKNGTPDLPATAQAPTFPQWDESGMVKLPDGRVLERDNADDLDRYENAKFRFESEQRETARVAGEKRAADEKAENDRRTAQRETMRQQQERVQTYVDARVALVDNLIQPAIANLAEEDKWLGELLTHGLHRMIEMHPETSAIGQDANQHVIDGDGRVTEFAVQHDRVARREATAIIEKFTNEIVRRNKTERALTGREPQIPGNQPAPTVTAHTPPSPETTAPRTREDLYNRGLSKVSAALANLPVTGR